MSSLVRTLLATGVAQALPSASGVALNRVVACTSYVLDREIRKEEEQARKEEEQARHEKNVILAQTEPWFSLEIRAKSQAGEGDNMALNESVKLREAARRPERTVGVLATTRHARSTFMKAMLASKGIASDSPLLEHKSGEIPGVLAVRAQSKIDKHNHLGETPFAVGTTTPWVSTNQEAGKNALLDVQENDVFRTDLIATRKNTQQYVAKEKHVLPEDGELEQDTNFLLFPAMKPITSQGSLLRSSNHKEFQRFEKRHGKLCVLAAAREAQDSLVKTGLLALGNPLDDGYPLVVLLSGEKQHEKSELKLVDSLLADHVRNNGGESRRWNELVFVVDDGEQDESTCFQKLVRKAGRKLAGSMLGKIRERITGAEEKASATVNATCYLGYDNDEIKKTVWGADFIGARTVADQWTLEDSNNKPAHTDIGGIQ